MAAPNPNYRQLDPQEIVATVRMLPAAEMPTEPDGPPGIPTT